MSVKKFKPFVLGYFGLENNQLDGQTIKTRSIHRLFEEKLNTSIPYYDTESIKSRKLGFISSLVKLIKSDSLIYLPAQNNLKKLFPLLYLTSKIFCIKIYYFVVGGWLPEFLGKHPELIRKLRGIEQIYTETNYMKAALEGKYGFSNITVFPNYRYCSYKPVIMQPADGLKIVFMSRISRMKGIEMIFDYSKTAPGGVTLDMYGPVNTADKDFFEIDLNEASSVKYKGVLEPDQIHETLAAYDVLVLPTKYFTEGLPGAIVDAYFAGIPVIVTEWLHAHEFVEHRVTGFIIPFNDGLKELSTSLGILKNDKQLLMEMKKNALIRSSDFTPEKAWEIISKTMPV